MGKKAVCKGVTQDMIDAWMDKYGEDKVHMVEVPVDDQYEEYMGGVVRNPPTPVLNEYLRKSERVPIDAAKTLLKTIWLGGDERILNDRTHMLAFMGSFSDVLVGGQGRIKKLSKSSGNSPT